MRIIAVLLVAGRTLFGLVLFLRPNVIAPAWIGEEAAAKPEAEMLMRAVGARDFALGLGALLALLRGRPARGWLEAGVVSDLGDVALNTVYFNRLPARGASITIAIAAIAALIGWRTAIAVDRPSTETPSPHVTATPQ